MKIVVVGCTHAGTAAVVNLKELHPESDITIYEKNDNISFCFSMGMSTPKVLLPTFTVFFSVSKTIFIIFLFFLLLFVFHNFH